MISRLSYDEAPEELASRHAGTTEVTLLWSERAHRAVVVVLDEGTGDNFELEIEEHDHALDLFNHPYAYAAARGLALSEPKTLAEAS
jgi:signal transduction histidine kinase